MSAEKSVLDDIIFRSVGIGVSDLKKSADFYSRVLGMKQVGTITLDYMDEIILAYPADNFARGSRLGAWRSTPSSAASSAVLVRLPLCPSAIPPP